MNYYELHFVSYDESTICKLIISDSILTTLPIVKQLK